jgi:hypothetical protein
VAEYTSPISGKKRQIPSPIEFLRAIGDYYQTLPQWTGPRRTGLANLPTDYRREELLAAGQVPGGLPSDYKQTELEAGRAAEAYRAGAGFPGQELAPVAPVAPVKTYEATPQGQFDRYFGSPEMDQYFGAASRGKGAPKTAEAALELASGKGVPEGTDIAMKYRAESAMGRGNMDEIVEAMGYKGSPLEQWARANPMLAFRQYNKKFPAGEPTIGPTPAALQASEGPMTAFGQEVKTFFPGAEPGADMDTPRLEGEELIDAYNYMRGQQGREPASKRVNAFLGQYGDLGALTK